MNGSTEDVLAIQRTITLIGRYSDQGRIADSVELYAEDGILDLGQLKVEGRSALLEFLTSNSAPVVEGKENTKHILTNISVDLDGDSASVRTYYQVLTPGAGLTYWGQYDDQFVRDNGTWKVKVRIPITDGPAAVG